LVYSGKELVNSLIYLSLVVIIPFLFSLFWIISLFKKVNETILLSYLFGLFFSIGALISLLFIVTTQDLAFGWATTLNIKPKELSNALNYIAIWKDICSSCIVDEHLAKISNFIRLGEAVSKEQIKNAKELGSWWKFLAMAILTYGVLFRAVLLVIAKMLSNRKKVKIVSEKNQEVLEDYSSSYANKITQQELNKKEYKTVGYYINIPPYLKNNNKAKDIVVVVKSWEPPILDFFDYLDELKEQNKDAKISIFLAGLNGKAKDEDVDIWLKKLNELKLDYEVVV
jgi:hypothetical protein